MNSYDEKRVPLSVCKHISNLPQSEAGLDPPLEIASQAEALPASCELDAIISSILTVDQAPLLASTAEDGTDLDLEDFLNAAGPADDVMNSLLNGSAEDPEQDAFPGSPPLLPAAPLTADPGLVSREHSYSAQVVTSHVCEFPELPFEQTSPSQRSIRSESSECKFCAHEVVRHSGLVVECSLCARETWVRILVLSNLRLKKERCATRPCLTLNGGRKLNSCNGHCSGSHLAQRLE